MPSVTVDDLGDRAEERVDHWRLSTFGPADEHPRRGGDITAEDRQVHVLDGAQEHARLALEHAVQPRRRHVERARNAAELEQHVATHRTTLRADALRA